MKDEENPEWTAEMFKRARPASEIPELADLVARKGAALLAAEPLIEPNQLLQEMIGAGEFWRIPFFDFVDASRRKKAFSAAPLTEGGSSERYSALIAATIAYLCDEMELAPPMWVWDVPALDEPWLVSDIEGLQEIIKARCPSRFKQWQVFVLDNFLSRV
jgi:hypothetical protein